MKKARQVLCALLCAAAMAIAADFGALKPRGYVSDFAGVIRPDVVEDINAYCARVEQSTGAQIALVTLPSLQGEPIEDVANLIYRKWGVGSKKSNEGVLLLLSIGERRSRLEVGYGLEPIIPDGYAGSVLREMRPALREQDYGQAMAAAAQVLGEKIAAAKGVSIGRSGIAGRPRPKDEGFPGGLLVVVGGLVLLMLLFGGGRGRRGPGGMGGNLLTGMLLGNLMSGGGGSRRSGGGFGGYDSGDSFGGFGGGDSGGGGASSDW
ncbi:MAG: TPM domain-containing protein [Acidobacteria bacterium]|nr:TPM domain-containing protein [Acidobacteriota bacterium]